MPSHHLIFHLLPFLDMIIMYRMYLVYLRDSGDSESYMKLKFDCRQSKPTIRKLFINIFWMSDKLMLC